MLVLTGRTKREGLPVFEVRSIDYVMGILGKKRRSVAEFAALPSEILDFARQWLSLKRIQSSLASVHAGWDLSVPQGDVLDIPSRDLMRMLDRELHREAETSPDFKGHSKNRLVRRIYERLAELPTLDEELAAKAGQINCTPQSVRTFKRVAYVTHMRSDSGRSGYQRRSEAMIAALRSHDLTVVEFSSREFIQKAQLEDDAELGMADRVFLAAELLAATLPEDTDAVIAASDWTNGWVACLAARFRGLPFAYEMRGAWELTYASIEPDYVNTPAFAARKRLEERLCEKADAVFAQNAAIFAFRGITNTDHVIPNGYEGATILSELQTSEAGVMKLAYVGSLVGYEGLDMALHAISELNARTGGISLNIVGDGAQKADLMRLTEKLGLSAVVTFQGSVPSDKALQFVQNCDCVILPRRDDIVCHVVESLKPLEALAYAKPVLSTPITPSLGVPGIECASDFSKDSYVQLLEMALKNADWRVSAGAAGQKFVAESRRWSKLVLPIVSWLDGARPSEGTDSELFGHQ